MLRPILAINMTLLRRADPPTTSAINMTLLRRADPPTTSAINMALLRRAERISKDCENRFPERSTSWAWRKFHSHKRLKVTERRRHLPQFSLVILCIFVADELFLPCSTRERLDEKAADCPSLSAKINSSVYARRCESGRRVSAKLDARSWLCRARA